MQRPKVLFHSPRLTPDGCVCRGVKQQLRIKQGQDSSLSRAQMQTAEIVRTRRHHCRAQKLHPLHCTLAAPSGPAIRQLALQSPLGPVSIRHKHLSEKDVTMWSLIMQDVVRAKKLLKMCFHSGDLHGAH